MIVSESLLIGIWVSLALFNGGIAYVNARLGVDPWLVLMNVAITMMCIGLLVWTIFT